MRSMCLQCDGSVPEAGGRLREVSLSAPAWAQFEASLHALAESRERSAGAFRDFAAHIAANNYSVFLDAANIAFFNTQWLAASQQCKFQWLQVKQLYERARALYPHKRPLVVIHENRCSSKFVNTREVQQFLQDIEARLLLKSHANTHQHQGSAAAFNVHLCCFAWCATFELQRICRELR
jgi:hypothetical protein